MPVDADEPLVEINLDSNESGDSETQVHAVVYECSICRRQFPAEQVYESNGAITCTNCWNQSQALANRMALLGASLTAYVAGRAMGGAAVAG